jgi:hypothetical protein
MKDMYWVFREFLWHLDTNFVHYGQIYSFEKFLMRQRGWVRECSSFGSAARGIRQARGFYEWHESNVFTAVQTGMNLETYAYFQNCLKKVIE